MLPEGGASTCALILDGPQRQDDPPLSSAAAVADVMQLRTTHPRAAALLTVFAGRALRREQEEKVE